MPDELDLNHYEEEFKPGYEFGLDQATIHDVGEFLVNLVGDMKNKGIDSIANAVTGNFSPNQIPDRYIRDISHWFLVHLGIIHEMELDADDRKRLRIFQERCESIIIKRRSK